MSEDATFGGYMIKHDRPPAFEGVDGEAYSASVYVDDQPLDDGQYGGAVLFVRWGGSGDMPVGHVETPIVARGKTPEEAQAGVLTLTLHELKSLLDDAVLASKERPDW